MRPERPHVLLVHPAEQVFLRFVHHRPRVLPAVPEEIVVLEVVGETMPEKITAVYSWRSSSGEAVWKRLSFSRADTE